MAHTLGNTLGMEVKELIDGQVTITMPVDQRHHQPYGILHGGASVALAETAASLGAWKLAQKDNKVAVGQEINANHLRPVQSGIVTAKAQVIHHGKNSQVWEIKIYDEEKKLFCISRCTLAIIDPLQLRNK
ncbi:MAG: hotdog fold thioesterase [Deltaproteobacteria bacterium]|nr:hotdog fold thioesterase [Deltaproteobacteria bacterium]